MEQFARFIRGGWLLCDDCLIDIKDVFCIVPYDSGAQCTYIAGPGDSRECKLSKNIDVEKLVQHQELPDGARFLAIHNKEGLIISLNVNLVSRVLKPTNGFIEIYAKSNGPNIRIKGDIKTYDTICEAIIS